VILAVGSSKSVIPIDQMSPFQPPAKRQAVRRSAHHCCTRLHCGFSGNCQGNPEMEWPCHVCALIATK